ncbi:MAG: hypothetical protein H7203_00335 [Rhizobacter sp.]|nr:hypothetical protein [Burkholderiales bacterium]
MIGNTAAQGLHFNGTHTAQDLHGAPLPVAWNTVNLTGNGPIQMLSKISGGPVNTVPGNDPAVNTINVAAVTGGTGHCGA